MNINHFGAVRLRVTGSGNLLQSFLSLDGVITSNLTPVPMSSSTDRYPNTLSNFMQQKAQLRLGTEEINESFLIREIYIYVRPTFASYAQ